MIVFEAKERILELIESMRATLSHEHQTINLFDLFELVEIMGRQMVGDRSTVTNCSRPVEIENNPPEWMTIQSFRREFTPNFSLSYLRKIAMVSIISNPSWLRKVRNSYEINPVKFINYFHVNEGALAKRPKIRAALDEAIENLRKNYPTMKCIG